MIEEKNVIENAEGINIISIIRNSWNMGINNVVSILIIFFAWLFTVWIPYINVGTTIGLWAFCIALGKNEPFSVEQLFSAKYRKYMGEFFLLYIIIALGFFVGMIFGYFPGIIIAIAWSQAIYLLVDKDLNPIEAINKSYQMTYGFKWTIFGSYFFAIVLLYLLMAILGFIYVMIDFLPLIFLFWIVVPLFFIIFGFSCSAYIYHELSKS